jgi:riboflavin kinase/FMN adenylyltransferase
MRVIHGSDDFPPDARGAVLAIGNFDGVHRGHQVLLRAARDEGRRRQRPTGVVLFEPHPRVFFQPSHPHFQITPLPRKLALLRELGLELAVVMRFDAGLAGLSADAFVARVIVAALGAAHVVVGYDFRFGKGRAGDPEALRMAGAAHGFGVTVVGQVGEAGEVFSSSAIRAELAQGDVEGAAHMLGHWWRVAGPVIGGAQRGTGLGFPTANVALERGVTLGHGIYAVRVYVDAKRYDGAAYLGTRPMFDNGEPVLEVFLFDFDGDLYGREIAVEFIDFVRADARLPSVEALVGQMTKDCARARALLAAAPEHPVTSAGA